MKTAPRARVPVHQFTPDGTPDQLDGRWCETCHLPEHHTCHTLPTTPVETTAYEARRLGEPDERTGP